MKKIAVLGGANVDILARSLAPVVPNDSNPGIMKTSFGGVSHNIALNLALMKVPVYYISAFADDFLGRQLYDSCRQAGLNLEYSQIIEHGRTSTYTAILGPDGEMQVAVADMDILEELDLDKLMPFLKSLDENDCLVLDTNLADRQLARIFENVHCRVFCDPISTAKAMRIRPFLSRLSFFKPNRYEAAHLLNLPEIKPEQYRSVLQQFAVRGCKCVAVSLAEDGLVATDGQKCFHLGAVKTDIASTTGAGDSFMSGYLYGQWHDCSFLECLQYGTAASVITLMSEETVNPEMSPELLETSLRKVRSDAAYERMEDL